MSVFLATIFTFSVAFVLHLMWWKIRVPQRQLLTLLLLFFAAFLVMAIAMLLLLKPTLASEISNGITLVYFALFYWSSAFCYMITYSAMEGDSPTLSLTREMARRGEQGMSREEMEEFFMQRPFIGARVEALVKDGVFIRESDGFRLAPGRYLFFKLILGYRRLAFGKISHGG